MRACESLVCSYSSRKQTGYRVAFSMCLQDIWIITKSVPNCGFEMLKKVKNMYVCLVDKLRVHFPLTTCSSGLNYV